MKEKIERLRSVDNRSAYKTLLELETITAESNELYKYFDQLLQMLNSDKSFVRIRGFRLICSLAKWDTKNKINDNIDVILSVFNDDNGVIIRQCIDKLNLILLYKQDLSDNIETKLKNIDLSKHRKSMQNLIKSDIDYVLKNL